MADVRGLLNRVWTQYRTVRGIADDFAVILALARLLRESRDRQGLDTELPYATDERYFDENVWRILTEAANEAGGLESLFDRHILFRLSAMLPGGRYPTPRHIVETMIRLAEIKPDHQVGDFACGSGGFLVSLPKGDDIPRVPRILGIEISPEWAELAQINANLNDFVETEMQIETGNALQVCTDHKLFSAARFDRILMNPPFGEKVEPGLAEKALGQMVGSRSETALTALALHRLAPNGRAAILVPSGLLFSNSTGERELRRQLVDQYTLEAVVSLPRDAFQPFSPLQTHLLLVQNTTPAEQGQVWFMQTEYDGYPAGRSRDLTQPPPGPSDLPLVDRVLTSRATAFDATFPRDQEPLVSIKKFSSTAGVTSGVEIKAATSATLSSVSLFPAVGTLPGFMLIDAATVTSSQNVCVRLIPQEGHAEQIDDRDSFLRDLYKPKKSEQPPSGSLLFRRKTPGQSVAISADGRLLGVTVSLEDLRKPPYDLRPEQYVQKGEEQRPVESPALLLGTIRGNQRKLLQRVDSLLGRLELAPIAGQQLPSPLLMERGKPVEPFGRLSAQQQAVWNRVRKKSKKIKDENSAYATAVLFTPDEIEESETSEVSDATRATLDLLERMGVIVAVSVADPNTRESVAFYRLVTERDHRHIEPQEPADEP
ncbi:MAG: class I SAM-dependent DNA methyltransferase [Candidatus Binatia bacterium]